MMLTFKARRCSWTGTRTGSPRFRDRGDRYEPLRMKQSRTKVRRRPGKDQKVSYDKEIRPILQAQCHGLSPAIKGRRSLRHDFVRAHAQGR